MPWLLLATAGLLEIVFAFAMKSSEGFTRWLPALVTVATGVASVILLSVSLKTIPVGTGYAVWTGIGAVGTAVVGILALGDSATPARIACIALILFGIIGLRLVPA
ncbi:DMT family transporter [Luteibacter sp. NPDC031894]|jgi:quaternary ammonium compound-resistance protein SugE|uniref:DMT family transporter n=1 Tax=Luteibacter sp. NPDC031894 TaxID=3390572 RepID=UPI003D09461F